MYSCRKCGRIFRDIQTKTLHEKDCKRLKPLGGQYEMLSVRRILSQRIRFKRIP